MKQECPEASLVLERLNQYSGDLEWSVTTSHGGWITARRGAFEIQKMAEDEVWTARLKTAKFGGEGVNSFADNDPIVALEGLKTNVKRQISRLNTLLKDI